MLAASINKYCYLTCRFLPPFFDHKYRVAYSRIENCLTIDEIQHPAVRAALKRLEMRRGVEIHHDGDLPARSGMGSSSSFCVGLLHALYALRGRMPSKRELALEGIDLEQNDLKETVGSQDQVTVAHGGLNHVVFQTNGNITVRPVTVSAERVAELDSHLMLFYTCIKRTASDVAQSYVGDLEKRKRQLRIMHNMVDEALSILTGNDELTAFGELLHESWQAKRSLSQQVSNSEVDQLYQAARDAGALGGKLTGAGGGGFMLLFVPPSRQARVIEALPGTIHVPFRLEFDGTQIIFCDRQEDFSQQSRLRDQLRPVVFRELNACQDQEQG
ncbi:MAG: kinase [Pseudomonadota bacterium]